MDFFTETHQGSIVPLMKSNREWINGIYKVQVKPDVNLIAEFKQHCLARPV